MGNYVNKLFYQNDVSQHQGTKTQASKEEEYFDESMHTPIAQRSLPIDPRSETVGIERTPIEVNCPQHRLSKRISAIPRHLQTKMYLETDIDKVMPLLTPKKSNITRDNFTPESESPRLNDSYEDARKKPTADYKDFPKALTPTEQDRFNILGLDPRSPAADFDRTPILTPKSLDRLNARQREFLMRRGSYETDVFSKFSYCETSSLFLIPEIQVISNTPIEEMTFDLSCCSDDLNKSCPLRSSYSSTAFESGEEGGEKLETTITENENCNTVDTEKDTQHKQTHTNDNDRIRIWRDSVSLENPEIIDLVESDSAEIVESKTTQKEEVMIIFDDNDHQKKKDVIGKRKKFRKSDIKIIADEKNSNESSKVRTPLGNRSNNGQKKTLLTKSPQVLRNKSGLPKILQENTPPHKRYVAKSKLNGMHWDPNSTVII